ncbi:hypothetical protein UA45_16625 [Morganella morganii]|uniref:Big-1 domain-containing protein n=1 Tax=Morganella morganii TaxID=582 RepID=A0A0D8L6N3_MORMO|nr:hypothetical protein UA45_16625 [Morganella morganii]
MDDVLVSAQYEETAAVPADNTVSFIYNITSAKVGTVKLDDTVTQKVADGISVFTYTAEMVDGNGNPVRQADLVVSWTQNKGSDVELSATTSKTDDTGKATITLTSTKKRWTIFSSVRSMPVPTKLMPAAWSALSLMKPALLSLRLY